MDVKLRIKTIRLQEKLQRQPEYGRVIGIRMDHLVRVVKETENSKRSDSHEYGKTR